MTSHRGHQPKGWPRQKPKDFDFNLKIKHIYTTLEFVYQINSRELKSFYLKSLRKSTFKRKYLWIVCGFLEKRSVKIWLFGSVPIVSCITVGALSIIEGVKTFQQRLKQSSISSSMGFKAIVQISCICGFLPESHPQTFSNIPRTQILNFEIILLITLFYQVRKTTALSRLSNSLFFISSLKPVVICHLSLDLVVFLIISYVFWSFLLAKSNWLKLHRIKHTHSSWILKWFLE